jgi:hypothetical protein
LEGQAGASGGSSASNEEEATDAATSTTPLNDDLPADDNIPVDEPELAASAGDDVRHEHDDAQKQKSNPETQPDEIPTPHVSAPLIEDVVNAGSTPAETEPVAAGTAANDNEPAADPLPATGIEEQSH